MSDENNFTLLTFNITFLFITVPIAYDPNNDNTNESRQSCTILSDMLELLYKFTASLKLNCILDFTNKATGIIIKDIINTFTIDNPIIIHGIFLSIFP